MKITDVETILLRLPVVREIGDGCQTICVIRVHTDEGIVGIGEA
ncbi:MAG: mandelate racemase/muconate lactonizing enzyme family protein, partial [Alphaproteobacteria bacterium]|nr:mandelate racemase/muconate lactonizing enzyme family protein [Alphaproteobacteria bacterium]